MPPQINKSTNRQMFLNCHTAFSFKYGTMPVQVLLNEAKRCGVHKLALTEINNVSSYIEMLRICRENRAEKDRALTEFGKEPYQLDIALGVEFRREHELLYIALAENNRGFEAINRFLSHHNAENKSLPQRAPRWDDVLVIYPFGKFEPETLLNNEFIGIRQHELIRLPYFSSYESFMEKFVVLHPVTFVDKIDFNVHRLLRAIDKNTLLSKLPAHEQARPD